MTAEHLGRWEPYPVRELPVLLREATFPWWVAGGWALDLFVGRQTREHEDVDIEVLRRDQHALRETLPGWDFQVARDGALRPAASDEWLLPEDNSFWCRPAVDALWALQILLAESEADTWICRRNPDIQCPISGIGLVTAEGLPYLLPEIQLLYKAKGLRPRDEADFEMVLPRLNADQRTWLAMALTAAHPGHPWLARV